MNKLHASDSINVTCKTLKTIFLVFKTLSQPLKTIIFLSNEWLNKKHVHWDQLAVSRKAKSAKPDKMPLLFQSLAQSMTESVAHSKSVGSKLLVGNELGALMGSLRLVVREAQIWLDSSWTLFSTSSQHSAATPFQTDVVQVTLYWESRAAALVVALQTKNIKKRSTPAASVGFPWINFRWVKKEKGGALADLQIADLFWASNCRPEKGIVKARENCTWYRWYLFKLANSYE